MSDGPSAPWTAAQVRVVAACDVAGALVVVASALVARGRHGLGDQLGWVDLAVLGLLLVVVANASLFLAARRAVGHRRLQLLPDALAAEATIGPTAAPEGRWFWLPGTVRAHAEGCPMVVGKPARPISDAQVRTKGLQRCEVCG